MSKNFREKFQKNSRKISLKNHEKNFIFNFSYRPSVTAIGPQFENVKPLFRKIEAPTSGTKWHNAPGTKKWYEAQSDEGHTYYWNTETNGNKIFSIFS